MTLQQRIAEKLGICWHEFPHQVGRCNCIHCNEWLDAGDSNHKFLRQVWFPGWYCGGEGATEFRTKPVVKPRTTCPSCHSEGIRIITELQRVLEERESPYHRYDNEWEAFLNYPQLTPDDLSDAIKLGHAYLEWKTTCK